MRDSIWFTTRSELFQGEPAWAEVARYAGPLRRLLDRRYARLSVSDREDLAQEILIDIKTSLAESHDRSRGRFRALLQTVVKRRVSDLLRRRRTSGFAGEAIEELPAPEDAAVEALDLERALIDAVAATRERFTQGKARDRDALYALADAVLHGRSQAEIAARTHTSIDQVARLLRRARDEVIRQLVAREIEIENDDPQLERAADIVRASLRRPGEEQDQLANLRDARLRESLELFLARLRAALPHFDGDHTAAGDELRRGLAFLESKT